MKTIKIYCRKCKIKLTEELLEISENEIYFPDNAEAVPEGRFVLFNNNSVLSILVNRKQDLLNKFYKSIYFQPVFSWLPFINKNHSSNNLGHFDFYQSLYLNLEVPPPDILS